MAGYIGAKVGTVTANAADIKGDISSTDTSPDLTLKNTTQEDIDGGRESTITFKGEQSGGEESTLAQIQASHDGTSDDEKGDMIFKINDGSDGNSPTERLRIGSDGATTITTEGNEDSLVLKSNDADANAGPKLQFNRNSASAADADLIGEMRYSGRNDASQAVDYARIRSQISDASDGTEDGQLQISTIVAGTMRRRVDFDPTETVFNDAGQDLDFRVEGNSATSMFHVDALNDRIGIGVNDPDAVLDISGASAGGNVLGILRVTQRVSGAAAYGLDVGLDPTTGDPVFSKIENDVVSECFRIDRATGDFYLGASSAPSAGSGGSAFRVDSNGRRNLFLSTSSSNNQGLIYFLNPNGEVGSITTNGSATAYNTSSDYRLKENVTDISNGITRIKQLAPKRFNFIADADKTVDGFLAHEAQTVVPEAVTGTKDEVDDDDNAVMQGIDQSKLVPLLTAALQEAIAKIETLETKVAALEAE